MANQEPVPGLTPQTFLDKQLGGKQQRPEKPEGI